MKADDSLGCVDVPGIVKYPKIAFMMTPANTSTKLLRSELVAAPVARNPPESFAVEVEQSHAIDSALEVFVAHQDLATGLRAKQALDYVGARLKPAHHLNLGLWRFELLEDAALRETAVRDASRADILFLSLHGDRPLPPGLRHWFQNWTLMRDERPCALVVSLDQAERDSVPAGIALQYVRDMAAAGGVELFPHFGLTPVEGGFAPGAIEAFCHLAEAAGPSNLAIRTIRSWSTQE